MDDLAGKLGEILNSPEGMKQVQELAGMLGLSGSGQGSSEPEPVPAAQPRFHGTGGRIARYGRRHDAAGTHAFAFAAR